MLTRGRLVHPHRLSRARALLVPFVALLCAPARAAAPIEGDPGLLTGNQCRRDADCDLDEVCQQVGPPLASPRIQQRRPPGICAPDRTPPVASLPTLPWYVQPPLGKLEGLPLWLWGAVSDDRWVAEATFWLDDAPLPTKFVPGDSVAWTDLAPWLTGPDGPYTVALEAVDAAGNRAKAEGLVILDGRAPKISVQAPPAGAVLGASPVTATVIVDERNPATLVVGATGQPAVSLAHPGYPSPVAYSVSLDLPEGAHTLTATASDAPGNAASDSVAFTVDLGAPIVTTGLADGAIVWDCVAPTDKRVLTWNLTVSDATATTLTASSGTALSASALPAGDHSVLATSVLSPGTNTIAIDVIDQAGHHTPLVRTVVFALGCTSPGWTSPAPYEGIAALSDLHVPAGFTMTMNIDWDSKMGMVDVDGDSQVDKTRLRAFLEDEPNSSPPPPDEFWKAGPTGQTPISRINFRIGRKGRLIYPTELEDFEWAPEFQDTWSASGGEDPIALLADFCESKNIELFLWIDVFDSDDDAWLQARPELSPKRWPGAPSWLPATWVGLPSFAFPEVREHYLALVDDLIARYGDRIAGLSLQTESHHEASTPTPPIGYRKYYGFEDPVVDAVRAEHGYDLDPIDVWADGQEHVRAAWQDALSEGFLGFVAEVKARMESAGKRLELVTFLGSNYHGQQFSPLLERAIERDLVDDLVVSRSRNEYLPFERRNGLPALRRLVDLGEAHGVSVIGHIFADKGQPTQPWDIVEKQFVGGTSVERISDFVERQSWLLAAEGARGLQFHDLDYSNEYLIRVFARAAASGVNRVYGPGGPQAFAPLGIPAELAQPVKAIFVAPAVDRATLEAFQGRPLHAPALHDRAFFKAVGVGLAEVKDPASLDRAWAARGSFDLLVLAQDALELADWVPAWFAQHEAEVLDWIAAGGALIAAGEVLDAIPGAPEVVDAAPIPFGSEDRAKIVLVPGGSSAGPIPGFRNALLRANELGRRATFSTRRFATADGWEVFGTSTDGEADEPTIIGQRVGAGAMVLSAAEILSPLNLELNPVLGAIAPELRDFWQDIRAWVMAGREPTTVLAGAPTILGGESREGGWAWTISVPSDALCELVAWSTPSDLSAPDATWFVELAGGVQTVHVDQRSATSALLGYYPFAAGAAYTVALATENPRGAVDPGQLQLRCLAPNGLNSGGNRFRGDR